MKKIFIICPVTSATDKERENLKNYVDYLKNEGYLVHYPYLDTNQQETSLNVNRINTKAIQRSDEVHIFYKRKSQGIHFDLGNLFSLKELHKNWVLSLILKLFGIKNPKVLLVKNQNHINDSGYTKLLEDWMVELNDFPIEEE